MREVQEDNMLRYVQIKGGYLKKRNVIWVKMFP